MNARSRWAVATVALCLFGGAAQALDSFRIWIDNEPSKFQILSDLEVTCFAEEDLKNEDGEWQHTEVEFDLIAPVYRGERDEVFVEIGVEHLDIDTDVRLLKHEEDFPDTLTDLDLGLTWKHFFANGWTGGINLSFGSASDDLFDSDEELTGSATAFVRIPHRQHNAWLLYLDMRNDHADGGFNYLPKPGFGYLLALSQKDWAVLGAPVSAVHWEPMDRLSLDASYVLLRTAHAKLTWAATERLDLYAGFDMDSKVFWRADRKDAEDSLVLRDKRAKIGVGYTVSDHVSFDVSGGYAWDRYMYEGETHDQRDKNRHDIEPGFFAALQLAVSF